MIEMPVYIALLQGINIGAKKRIKMDALRTLLTELGGGDVRTYVNSGNAVFQHDAKDAAALERQIETALRECIGMDVPTILRTASELEKLVSANPFPEAVEEPKTLHVLFLRAKPEVEDVNIVEEMETGADRIAIHGREVYAFLPNFTTGATVDLMAVAKALRQDGTSRNWNTVARLAEMAGTGN
jgi:uncharacterized protein (DUF1697 family)